MEVMVPAVPSKAPLGGAPVGPVWTEITALVKNYEDDGGGVPRECRAPATHSAGAWRDKARGTESDVKSPGGPEGLGPGAGHLHSVGLSFPPDY